MRGSKPKKQIVAAEKRVAAAIARNPLKENAASPKHVALDLLAELLLMKLLLAKLLLEMMLLEELLLTELMLVGLLLLLLGCCCCGDCCCSDCCWVAAPMLCVNPC